ncbi:hypothetical protein ACINB_06950 [Acidovorax sp. NB1]|nr:hypothetical protein ACINB_06950 [Acidovorax sp. NB1]
MGWRKDMDQPIAFALLPLTPSPETPMSTKAVFHQTLATLTEQIAGRPLDAALADWLNQAHGPESDLYQCLMEACVVGVREGWLCEREGGGIRYGRVFKPEDALHRFSVDVVDMQDLAGPHHSHPGGEIDLIMPLTQGATFDGHPAGWCVYPPGSAHHPTVAQGRALVLYLLPEGQIHFTR